MKLAGWRLVKELVESVDAVVELVDIRDPLSTRSHGLEGLSKEAKKPLILVLNKADLVPLSIASRWKEYFERVEALPAVYISAKKHLGTRILRKKLIKEVGRVPLTAGIFGIPKVGKSTLINALKGRHSATTSPYPGSPGYTHKIQMFKLGENVYLIDTPGVIPPENKDIETAIRSHGVDTLGKPVQLALELVKKILKYRPGAFKEAYDIDLHDPESIIREIALARGLIYKQDKEPNLTEASKVIIRDYLSGRIPFYVKPPLL